MPRVKEVVEVTNVIELSDRAIYLTNPKLANALGKSLATILNWIREGRIIPDAFVDGDKANNAIYTIANVKQLQHEVRTSPSGRPEIKGIVHFYGTIAFKDDKKEEKKEQSA